RPRPFTIDAMPTSVPLPRVAVVMGSDSDWPVMKDAASALAEFGIEVEVEVLSAHRTPDKMISFGRAAAGRGIGVIIAGAGGAAHLPGMIAAVTTLPVIGVPVPLARLDGLDSLLSIVQMPAGVPVATVSIGGARNAGLLAVRMLSITSPELAAQLAEFALSLEALVAEKNDALKAGIAAASSTAASSTTASSTAVSAAGAASDKPPIPAA
ncbi:MAG: purE, partial [Glaciihabitans sp.]|nr:purE [Glaciihabitans sp.]